MVPKDLKQERLLLKKSPISTVAGMTYAEYVEAMDNKVVLASAELFARQQFPSMMQKLKSQIAL